MRLQFLGSGDAFGSGGRFNTCYHLQRQQHGHVMIDCGASSMVTIRKWGVDPNGISTILISHLHGDHFGGLPFFLLDAQLISRRATPLTIAGPPGLIERLQIVREAMSPAPRPSPRNTGSRSANWRCTSGWRSMTSPSRRT